MNDTLRTERHPLRELRRRGRSAMRALLVTLTAALLAFPALAGSVSYTYDALGRLAKATYSNGVVITYSYDAAGNRSSQVIAGVP